MVLGIKEESNIHINPLLEYSEIFKQICIHKCYSFTALIIVLESNEISQTNAYT